METKVSLTHKKCIPCKGDVYPLKGDELIPFKNQISEDWSLIAEHHLEKEYRFVNFKKALDFTNRMGDIAENENHHPVITLTWGSVKVTIWTHKINGLTENDFILAAKFDEVFEVQ